MYYKNGRLAKDGDIVYGPSYNRTGERVGVIHSIKPDQSTCNCSISFSFNALPIGYSGTPPLFGTRVIGGSTLDFDYSECGKLIHVDDYLQSLQEGSNEKDSLPSSASGE